MTTMVVITIMIIVKILFIELELRNLQQEIV